jgi:hypothetical protein
MPRVDSKQREQLFEHFARDTHLAVARKLAGSGSAAARAAGCS